MSDTNRLTPNEELGRQFIQDNLDDPIVYPDPPTPQAVITKPKLNYSLKGFAGALEHVGARVRANVRADSTELAWPDAGIARWEGLTDHSEAYLRAVVSEKVQGPGSKPDTGTQYRPGSDRWAGLLAAHCFTRKVDPVLQMLEDLPAWDGVQRLDSWLDCVFDLADDQSARLTAWAARFMFAGVIVRAYQPGAKLDEMPVLIGPQAVGKSTAIRCILPEHMQSAGFADGLELHGRGQERIEATLGKVVVEVSEMAGSTMAQLEDLKAFLSRVDDGGIRLAYRRNPTPIPRRFILVGSSNRDRPLPNDPDGNRRFVTVRIAGGPGGGHVARWLEDNRHQLWAEALNSYHHGSAVERQAWLPDELKHVQDEANEHARNVDELIEHRVDQLAAGTWLDSEPRTLLDIFDKLHLDKDDRSLAKRIASALQNAGYASRLFRHDGRRARYWRKS